MALANITQSQTFAVWLNRTNSLITEVNKLTDGNITPTIVGGSINGTPIGASSASTGSFTTISLASPLSVANGGTGATNATDARANLGVSNASNLTSGTLDAARLSGTYAISISGNASTATNVSGVIALANGGTGATTAPAALTALGAVAKAGDTMTGSLNMGGNALTGVTSINGGPTPGQNAIINGDFRFNQRGAASYSGGAYGLDRWLGDAAGSSLTHSQQSFTPGQTDVPGEPKNYARCVVSSVAGAGNYSAYLQSIEGVRTFAGQTATLSFWARADAAKNIAVELEQNFGTGGSPSSPVTGLGLSKLALTTAWQQFSVMVTPPSISGKTIGTAGNDRLTLLFWMDAGSDFNARTDTLGQQSGTFEFADVQIKLGSTVTPYDRIDDATELARCERYTQLVSRMTGIWISADEVRVRSAITQRMRASPTAILTTASITAELWNNTGHPTSSAAITGNVSSPNSAEVTIGGFGATGRTYGQTAYVGNNDFLLLDADF